MSYFVKANDYIDMMLYIIFHGSYNYINFHVINSNFRPVLGMETGITTAWSTFNFYFVKRIYSLSSQ